jgi:hypothetical protein
MPCDTRLKPRQTISERKIEVLKATERFIAGIKSGKIKVKVSPKGGVVFEGISDEERDGVTDACAYRRIMVSGSAMATAAIARAEQMAGRTVDKQLVGQGYHSHDGGVTWHDHKG